MSGQPQALIWAQGTHRGQNGLKGFDETGEVEVVVGLEPSGMTDMGFKVLGLPQAVFATFTVFFNQGLTGHTADGLALGSEGELRHWGECNGTLWVPQPSCLPGGRREAANVSTDVWLFPSPAVQAELRSIRSRSHLDSVCNF